MLEQNCEAVIHLGKKIVQSCLLISSKTGWIISTKTSSAKLEQTFKAVTFLRKKVRPTCSSYHTENSLNSSENINQIFWTIGEEK